MNKYKLTGQDKITKNNDEMPQNDVVDELNNLIVLLYECEKRFKEYEFHESVPNQHHKFIGRLYTHIRGHETCDKCGSTGGLNINMNANGKTLIRCKNCNESYFF